MAQNIDARNGKSVGIVGGASSHEHDIRDALIVKHDVLCFKMEDEQLSLLGG